MLPFKEECLVLKRVSADPEPQPMTPSQPLLSLIRYLCACQGVVGWIGGGGVRGVH